MDGMFNIFKRITAGALALGLALWAPGAPWALAQVEITPEIRQGCESFDPALREIALSDVIPAIEADPEGVEARVVETAAVAIHEATETTRQAFKNPDEVVETAMAALEANGVPPEAVRNARERMHLAMAEASRALDRGATVVDLENQFGQLNEAVAGCLDFLPPDRGIRDIFIGAEVSGTGQRNQERTRRAMEILGTVAERPSDLTGAALEAYFHERARQVMHSDGGPVSREVMDRLARGMASTGFNPGEIFTEAAARGRLEAFLSDPSVPEGMKQQARQDFARLRMEGNVEMFGMPGGGTGTGYVGAPDFSHGGPSSVMGPVVPGEPPSEAQITEARKVLEQYLANPNVTDADKLAARREIEAWSFGGGTWARDPRNYGGPEYPGRSAPYADYANMPSGWAYDEKGQLHFTPGSWDSTAIPGGGNWDPATHTYSSGWEGSNYGINPATGGWEPNMGGTAYTGGGNWDPATTSGGTSYTTTTTEYYNHNYDNTQTVNHDCSGLTEAQKAEHRLHGHCDPVA